MEETETGVYHDGERAVQRRAGVQEAATKLESMVLREIPEEFARFLESEHFVYLASETPAGAVWVSALFGRSGFARATAPDRLEIRAPIRTEDPLAEILLAGPSPIGMLVIEPMTRGRIRLGGIGRLTEETLVVELREAFGNCPKYIQRRRPVGLATPPPAGPPPARTGDRLDGSQQMLASGADTFIVGSRHPERGVDCSHRGGRPGFVIPAADGRSLAFPDYRGNNMFKTLGNLALHPAIGLLFVDWRTGRTLQLTGRARIDWESPRLAAWPGAQRLVEVSIDSVVDRADGLPVVWEEIEASKVNPPAPGG